MSSDNNKANVSTGKPKIGGAIFRAPTGTTLPTDATTTLNSAFKCVGYISDAGVANDNSMTSNVLKAWGGDPVLVTNEGTTDTFAFSMIEALNDEVLKAYYGDSAVTGALSTGIAVAVGSEDLGENSWVIDMELNGNTKKRLVIPSGRISAKGTITYVDNAIIAYPLTITGLPDSSEKTHYDYTVKANTT